MALTPVATHARRVRDLLPLPAPVDVALDAADGLVLAADLIALVPLPGFDNSAMDGYAVRRTDLADLEDGRSVHLPVSDDIPAGRTDVVALVEGTAARIMTGAPLPPGADVVVPVEWTDAPNGGAVPPEVEIRELPTPHQHLRRQGEEASPGDVVLPAGTPLTPTALGLAAAVGHATVSAYPRPRVLVLSTGSELAPPGEPLRPGQIYESNSPMLVAAVRRAGGLASALMMVPDDVEQFSATLREAAGDADLILTSGGVSAGAYEVVKDALTAAGTVQFDKVGMQPGMPQGCGTFEGVPIVTLPGNPVSVYVSFEVFVRPALRARMGYEQTGRRTVAGVWRGGSARSPEGKQQMLRAHYDIDAGDVSPVGTPPSHLLASLARADCLVLVPADVTSLRDGDEFETWLLDGAETASAKSATRG